MQAYISKHRRIMNIEEILQQENFSNVAFKGLQLTHFDGAHAYFDAFNDTYVKTEVPISFEEQLQELINYVDGSDTERDEEQN